MGDRRHVVLQYEDGKEIYIYTHWYGSSLPSLLAKALVHGKERWNDVPYLARIIFSQLLKGDEDSLTGWGLAPNYMESQKDDLYIDLSSNTVNGKSFQKFIDYHEDEKESEE